MVTIINATPHAIKVLRGGEIITFEPSEFIARVKMEKEEVGSLNGFNLSENRPGDVEGLPPENEGRYYIVSAMVLASNKHRTDLIAPDTGATAVRNEKGHIDYVLGFIV